MALIDDIPRCWQRALNSHPNLNGWQEIIGGLETFLQGERDEGRAYHPTGADIFAAFRMTCFCDVRVVIAGHNPYPNRDDAMGLAFSAPRHRTRRPASLRLVYQALSTDYPAGILPTHSNLEHWAGRGVLLLNRELTFRAEDNDDDDDDDEVRNAHRDQGWKDFTRIVVRALANSGRPIHYILWGAHAQGPKRSTRAIGSGRIHEAPHPSPLNTRENARRFRTCGHFSKVNEEIRDDNGIVPEINWFE